MTEQSTNRPVLSNKRDIIILMALLGVFGLWLLWSYVVAPALDEDTELAYAWVYHENTLLEKVALDGEDRVWNLTVPDDPDIEMEISSHADHSISVTASDCPDKVCVHTGKIHMKGQSIACLPNHVIVKIGTEEAPGGLGVDG